MIKDWIAAIVAAFVSPREKPSDLLEFEEAQKRLRDSGRRMTRAVVEHIKEADNFGDLVEGMRGVKRKTTKRKSRRC